MTETLSLRIKKCITLLSVLLFFYFTFDTVAYVYVAPSDCNDLDWLINPAAKEICDDGKDNDCNGLWDYDSLDRGSGPSPRGDLACPVNVIAIALASSITPDHGQIKIECTVSTPLTNSLYAEVNATRCMFLSRNASTVAFICPTGATGIKIA